MNLSRRLVFSALVGGLAALPIRALEWGQTRQEIEPAPGAEVVRTKFEFKNPAKKTVHILEVRTSCGCTEAAVSSSEIAAGESGFIHVLFTVGQRTGLQEKEITVLTDDSAAPVKLLLKITLPPAAAGVAAASAASAKEK